MSEAPRHHPLRTCGMIALWMAIGLVSAVLTSGAARQWGSFAWRDYQWATGTTPPPPWPDSDLVWPSKPVGGRTGSGLGWTVSFLHTRYYFPPPARVTYDGEPLEPAISYQLWTGFPARSHRVWVIFNSEGTHLFQASAVNGAALALSTLMHGTAFWMLFTAVRLSVRRVRRRGVLKSVRAIPMFLLAGLVATVAVTWIVSVRQSPFIHHRPLHRSTPPRLADLNMMDINAGEVIRRALGDAPFGYPPPREHDSGPWVIDVPDKWPARAQDQVRLTTLGQSIHYQQTNTSFTIQVRRVGWPFRCLEQTDWYDTTSANPRRESHRVGFGVPTLSGRTDIILPIRPLFPGLVINSVLYGFVLWIAFAAVSETRRVMRLRRGGCPKCGYDLTGLDGCPECGWNAVVTDPSASGP